MDASIWPLSEITFEPGPAGERGGRTPRSLFHDLLHVDERSWALKPAYDLACESFGRIPAGLTDAVGMWPTTPGPLAPYLAEVAVKRKAEVARCLPLAERLDEGRVRTMLAQLAPSALLGPVWSQRSSSPAITHTEVGIRLVALYVLDLGDDALDQNDPCLAWLLLRSAGLELPEVASWNFAHATEVDEESFAAALPALCASQFLRPFLPELLGLALFAHTAGAAPAYLALLPQLRARGCDVRYLERHQPHGAEGRGAALVLEAIEALLASGDGSAPELWARLGRGFAAGFAGEAGARARWARLADPDPSPQARMTEMVRRKAPFARGFHTERNLGDDPLEPLVREAAFDPTRLLRSLAGSRFVVPGDAANSPFLTELVAFGGPMFAVFSPEELSVIRAWIDSLPAGNDDVVAPPTPAPPVAAQPALGAVRTPRVRIRSIERASVRDLFHYLVNIDAFPAALPEAQRFVEGWLTRSARAAGPRDRPPEVRRYSHAGLMAWQARSYREQTDAYRRGAFPPRTRESVVEDLVQRTPLVLVEGVWLSNVAAAGFSHTSIANQLLHIYWDEVGNGRTHWHHANVWRRMMTEIGEHFAPFDSREFADSPRFFSSAFQFPVFMLAIGLFPKRFLPETIGLTLAIESALLGASLLWQVDELQHHGIDATHPALHNTIDNPSTGHTRSVLSVVRLYLDDVLARGGEAAVDEHWTRIWTGYETTRTVPRALSRHLMLSASAAGARRAVARSAARLWSRFRPSSEGSPVDDDNR